MHTDGFFYPVAEGLFALTPKGAGLAEGLLCEPLGLRQAETKTVEPFWLSDAQMHRISMCFPQYSGEVRKDDRAVMSGIVHVLRSGIAWGRAPACYGKSARLFHRFRQWAVAGVLDQVLSNLLEPSDGRMTLVIDDVVLLSHRTGRTYAAKGCFPILAPVEDMPCAV
nr:transposase [Neokomagataea anthophila]